MVERLSECQYLLPAGRRAGSEMRIFDCFTFCHELDLLRVRLEELGEVVDRFVLVEATRSHTGYAKPLYFRDNRARFDDFADRIAAFALDDLPDIAGGDPWTLEREQRARIGDCLARLGARDDDLVLVSDADEIPRASAVASAIEMVDRRRYAIFVQTLYRYFLNNVTEGERHRVGWCGTVAFRYRELREMTAQKIRGRWCSGGQLYRHASWGRRRRCIPDAGWHFTRMGGYDAVLYKEQSYAHGKAAASGADSEPPVAYGASAAPEEEPACEPVDGSCACGCMWKGVRQRYTPIERGSDFEVACELPEFVKANKHSFASLFRYSRS